MGKTKLQITVEFDETQGLNSALKRIFKFHIAGKDEQLLEMKSNYRIRINKELEQSEIVDCKFERVEIDGKEKVCMIIPSRLNKE